MQRVTWKSWVSSAGLVRLTLCYQPPRGALEPRPGKEGKIFFFFSAPAPERHISSELQDDLDEEQIIPWPAATSLPAGTPGPF